MSEEICGEAYEHDLPPAEPVDNLITQVCRRCDAEIVTHEAETLVPGSVIEIEGVQHRIGTVVVDRQADTGEVVRASAYSATEEKWLELLSLDFTVVR